MRASMHLSMTMRRKAPTIQYNATFVIDRLVAQRAATHRVAAMLVPPFHHKSLHHELV